VLEQDFDQLIGASVDAVLETMFFSAPLGPAEPETGGAVLEARLQFRGNPSGAVEVCLSEPCARLLAAGFLGEDEDTLTSSQPGEVVCELANMLCGSLVSNLETKECFELTTPELVRHEGAAVSQNTCAARRSFELENGILTVALHLQTAA
jgi:CheY-specific phosphatase CheX